MKSWHNENVETTLNHFGVNPQTGLSDTEVKQALEKHGPNKLVGQPKKSLFSLFLSQMKDVLIYVLLGAALITLIIGHYIDAIIILLVVFLNASIGVFQANKAEKAIEALQKMSTPRALVRRNSETVEINSEDIVPGDILILDAGRFILADLRLIESANLQIEEATLTGESVASEKNAEEIFDHENMPLGDQSNMAFMSTVVTYGRGEGIAIATGMQTEIGKIAKILDEDNEELTPLQKRLEELGKILGYMAVGICGLILIIGFFQKRDLFDLFLTAISLAVAAIPEGLAAIVAIVLSLGVTRMSKINAIVKKLPAVETLGSVNIICSDKTGTLTQNKMTVTQTFTWSGSSEIKPTTTELSPDELTLVEALVLSSDATYSNDVGTGDPTEIAFIVLGNQMALAKETLNDTFPRVDENPFDSQRKRMSTLIAYENNYRVYTKGAIDSLLPLCTHILENGKAIPITEEHKEKIGKTTESMSNQALRVIGCAFKTTEDKISSEEMESNLTFIGLVGMIDPPRLEVRDSISKAANAGIKAVMITGDHKNTAFAIAKELGIASSMDQSLSGSEIDALSDEDFVKNIEKYRVFARVSPEHKVKIVRAFKSHGHVVSMTGDGVNDAPSLKFADIGVAMGITGTDVSKSASDMILTDDNFTTIVHAIEEGRNIYSNIKKAVIFLLSCNLGEVVAILTSVLFFWPIPLLPTQILWINLITDSLPAIALGIDPGDKDIMSQKPRDPKESFFSEGAGFRAILGGLLIGTLTLFGFHLGLSEFGFSLGDKNIPDEVLRNARTMAFVILAASQLFYAMTMRHRTKSIFQVGLFTNKALIGAILMGLFLQFVVISVPFLANAFKVQMLSMQDWGIVLLLALCPVLLNEIFKFFLRIKEKKS